jgi:hypothetical protein
MGLYSYDRRGVVASAGGRRNILWTYLNAEQRGYVRNGFTNSDPPLHLLNVPVGSFAYDRRSLLRAHADVRRGRLSKTHGSLDLRYDPDKDTFFLIDGYHRLAQAMVAKEPTIDVRIVGSGYSDYWATP